MSKQPSHERQPGSCHGRTAEIAEIGRRIIAQRGGLGRGMRLTINGPDLYGHMRTEQGLRDALAAMRRPMAEAAGRDL
jgi:hypothetical protein